MGVYIYIKTKGSKENSLKVKQKDGGSELFIYYYYHHYGKQKEKKMISLPSTLHAKHWIEEERYKKIKMHCQKAHKYLIHIRFTSHNSIACIIDILIYAPRRPLEGET